MRWLPGAERIDGQSSGDFAVGYARKLLLHTTQGTSIAGAVGAYRKNRSWPHLTVHWEKRRVAQHVAFDRAARALKNSAGGVETNRGGPIQVEIVGYAQQAPNWPDEQILWLAEILRPVVVAWAIRDEAPAFVGPEAGYIAHSRAAQRMAPDIWVAFAGVCGHQHVPENDHWDPGAINISLLRSALFPPTTEELEMHPIYTVEAIDDNSPTLWYSDLVTFCLPIPTEGDLWELCEERGGRKVAIGHRKVSRELIDRLIARTG